MHNLTGREIGPYHLIERFYAEQMTGYYHAHNLAADRLVTLKLMRSNLSSGRLSEAGQVRFARHARALMRLKHPHLLSVQDFGLFEGAPYLVFDGPIEPWTPPAPGLVSQSVRMAAQLAWALEYAWRHHLAHLDIRPESIFRQPDGLPVFADFGTTHLLESEGFSRCLRSDWAAPEQAGGQSGNCLSDIYTLAAVLKQRLLSKHQPHQLAHPAPGLAAAEAERSQALPAALQALLKKALAPLPQDRFANLGAFARALETVSGGDVATIPLALRTVWLP